MSKVKTAFFCSNCGYESTKWVGKCPSCGSWNSFIQEVIQKDTTSKENSWNDYHEEKRSFKTIALKDILSTEQDRVITPDAELNRVLGGGIVPGSIVLIAGEPGIGKSTLFLQNALQMQNIRTLYISGEESERQIKMRADRLGIANPDFYLLTETSTQVIFQEIKKIET